MELAEKEKKEWTRYRGSKGLIWSKEKIFANKVSACASMVIVGSLGAYIVGILVLGS